MELKYGTAKFTDIRKELLIVLNGIEMCELESKSAAKVAFNRTKWN